MYVTWTYKFAFLNIYGVHGSFIFRPNCYVTYRFLCHFLKIWFTLLINQPFKTLLGASNFLKNSWTCFSYIIPFKNIFQLPFPLKIVIFGSIFYPTIFDFSSGPIVKSYSLQLWLYIFIPHSFLETIQGLMEILLVS